MRDHAMDTSRGSIYDHDIPSLSASLEAFDPERSMHSAYSGRSNMHSSRWSVPQDDMESETESEGPWAPPAWQKSHSSNNWYRKSLFSESARPSASRSPSYYRTDRDVTPSRIPLPESPMKQTPRTSPEPLTEDEQRYFPDNIASRLQRVSEEPHTMPKVRYSEDVDQAHGDQEKTDGFVRFAIRGETLFRTAPIEDTISTFASITRFFTTSRWNVIFTIVTLTFSWLLVQPWTGFLIPDVANVANMVRQFEPLMYGSVNVVPRSRELVSASIAVQDLGESLRASSASETIIVQLDGLAQSLKDLSEQMNSFFSKVDGDMDNILFTMDWATRQLQSVPGPRNGMIHTAMDNVHGGLGQLGLLENSEGSRNALGRIVHSVLGNTAAQQTRGTLQRIFTHLLSGLENNVENELHNADALNQLFESVEQQFQTLHRSVALEEDTLETIRDEFLASMWRSTVSNKQRLKKYEKNLKLLKDVRSSTLSNKNELKEHIQIIRSVRDQLELARKKLVTPLIRDAQSTSYGIEQQLQDLNGTHALLHGVREGQKIKYREVIWAKADPQRLEIDMGSGGKGHDETIA